MNPGSWLSWWKRAWKRGGSQVSQRRGKGRPRVGERRAYLRLEQLEDRTVPTNNIPLHPVNWTPLGPVAINPGGNPAQPWSGPIASVASSPAAPNVWYVATVGGGVWKSVDSGTTWTPLTDFLAEQLGLPQASLSFGMIAVAPTNADFVMVESRSLQNLADRFGYGGSIDLDFTIYNTPGSLGWLVSNNGGATWFRTDGDTVPDGPGGIDTNLNDGPFVGATVDKVVFSPFNPNEIYMAVSKAPESGIYRSLDGGRTWENITINRIRDSQGNFTSGGRRFSDVVLDPTNPRRLWAAIGDPGGHELNGLWESRDGGNSWVRAPNFPTGRFEPRTGYIRMAIAPGNPNVMYAIVRDALSGNATYRFMASVDGGNWWAPVNMSAMAGLTGPGPGTFVRPVRLVVDATDATRVYYTVGSTIATARFTPMPPPFNDPTQFTVTSQVLGAPPGGFELTEVVVDPAGGFLVTTEGGIWRGTLDASGNINWQPRNTGLQIALVNSVAHSLLTDSLMYAGTRYTGLLHYNDNDSIADWTGRNTSPNTVGRVLADQIDPNYVYWVDFNNNVHTSGSFQVRWSNNQGASSFFTQTFNASLGLSGGDIMRNTGASPSDPSPSPPAGAPIAATPFTGQEVRFYFPPLEMDPDFNRMVLATNAVWQLGVRGSTAVSQIGDFETVTWRYWDWNDANNNNAIDPGEVVGLLTSLNTTRTFLSTTFAPTTIDYFVRRQGGFAGPFLTPGSGNADELRSVSASTLALFTSATGSPKRVWVGTADFIQRALGAGGDFDPTPANPASIPSTPPPPYPSGLGRTAIRWVDSAVSGSNTSDIDAFYIVAANYRGSYPSPYGTAVLQSQVYMTTDGGSSWNSIGDLLPDVPVRAIAVEPRGPGWQDDVVYVGTDGGVLNGVYATLFRGTFDASLNQWVWTPMQPTSPSGTRLPLVPITDLQINQQFSTLLVATYGRGIWGLYINVNLPPEIKVPGPQVMNEDSTLTFSPAQFTEISILDRDAGTAPVELHLEVQHGRLSLASTLGLTLVAGNNNSPSMTYRGSQAAINAALNGLVYTPDANYFGVDTLVVRVSDLKNSGVVPPAVPPDYATKGWTTEERVEIRITPINDAPQITAPTATQTVPMNRWLAFTSANGNSITVADADAGVNPMTLTLGVSHGTLTLGSTAGLLTVTGNGTSSVSVTGSLLALNNALSGLVYTPNAGYSGSDTLTITVTDNGHIGSSGPLTDTKTVSIQVSSANNDAPYLSVPGPQDVLANSSLVLSSGNGNALQIQNEPDAGSGGPWAGAHPVRFTVSVSQGKLQLLNPGTLYLVQGPNDGTASLLTFEGPVSDVNTALANGLLYVPNSGFVGNDLLVFTVNDLGATGSGGPQSDSDTVLLRVMNANQAPVNTVPGPQTVAEDTDLVFAGTLSVADADAGSNPIQVTLSVSHGVLILATTSGLTSVVGNNSPTITMQGPQAAINAALNGLRYRPDANYNGPDTLTITTNDLGNSGFGGPQTDTDTVSITVTAVNDAPTITLPNTQFTAMNTSLTLPAIGVGDVDDADDGTSGNIVLQVTLSVTNGDLTLPTTAGLTFSVGDGTSDPTMTFSGQLSDILAALNGVVYNPAINFTGVATLSVSVNDLGNSGAGGAQGASGSLLIAVGMPGNQAPVNAVPPAPQTTLEDVPLEFSTINNNAITFDTPFAGDNPFEVQLSVTNGILVLARTSGIRFIAGSNASASMTIEGRLADIHAALDGLKYIPTLDYSGPAQLTVTGRFVGEPPDAADTVTIPIQVFPANDPPRVSVPLVQSVAPNAQLYFNAANNNALSVTDPDNTSGNVQFTISVTSGTLVLLDTTGLSISGNGTSTITGSGPINVLNLRLAGSGPTTGLRFTAPGSNTVVTLTFTVNDLGNTGTGGAQSHSARVLIRVGSGSLANNQAPTINVQGGSTKTVPEDQFFIFSSTANHGITITDADAGSNIVQVSLSLLESSGFLVLPTIAGLEFTSGGNAQSSMTIRGSIASINAALSGMVYYPNPNFVGSDTLRITVSDLGNMGGPLPPPPPIQTPLPTNITLNVTPVNDAPLIYVPRGQYTPVNTSLVFSSGNNNELQVFDPDLSLSDTVEFALRVDFGTLTILTPGSLVVANNGTDFVTGIGTFGDLQAALSSGIQFDPPPDFQGLVNLTFSVNDLSPLGPKTGVGNALVGVGVTPPTTPVLVRSPGSVIVDEDGTLVFSTANNNRISISDADAGTNPVEVTLSVSAGTLTLGSVTGLTFTAGSNGSSSMTFRGTIAAINNALEGLTFAPPPNFNGPVTLTVVTNDLGNLGSGGPQTDTDTVIIKVRPINDGPAVVLAASSQAIVQDTALVFSSSNGNAITFSDLELTANSTIDVRLEVDQGILHLPDVTGLVFLDGGNNSPSFTIRSTKSIIESKLNGLVYIPPSGFTGTATLKVSISDLGQTGFGGALSDTQNITIAVQPMNARPTVNVPGPQSVYRNQTLTLSGANAISITDADGNVPVEVVLAVSSGRLFLPNTSGLTLVMGNNSSRLTIRGLRNTVNLRLNGLQFIPAYDYDGLVLLTATVNDLGNSNGGGPLTAGNSVLINVQPVNSQPTALPDVTSFSLTEDQSGPFTINLSYITPGGGVFEAGQSLTLTVTEVPVNLNGFSTLFSTLTINNTSFVGGGPWPQSTFVSFSLAPDAFGDAVIRITIQDDGGTANGGQNTLVIDIPVSVERANDAPLLATGTYALGSIPEDPASNPGISVLAFVSTLISGGHYSDADDGHPSGYTDPRGIAITAVDNSNGTWQYSTDGGNTWTNIPSIGAGQGFVLAADAAGQNKIRFVPNADWNGTTTITFRAWDQSDSASNASLVSIPPNGTPPSDTSAYSANSATAQLTVTPVNDPPFASSTSTNWTNPLQEDNFPSYPEITLTDLKPGPNTATDETSQTMSVSANLQVISGPMSGTFWYSVNGGPFTTTAPTGLSINDDVVVQFQPAANASGNADIVITIQDSGGEQATLTFSLQITPQNDAPVLGVGPWNLGTIVEDPPSNPGISIRQFIANNSGMISDADDAPPGYFDPRGIAITAFDNSNGTWQYSTNGGASWFNLPGLSPGDGLVLAADAADQTRIRFVPNPDWNGTTTITFRAWDQSDTWPNGTVVTFPANGTPPNDTSPYSSTTATAQLTVTPVNDPPEVDLNGSAAGIDYTVTFDPPGPQTIAIVDSTGLTVTDVDSPNLSGATITLTNPQDGTSERLIIGGLLSNGTVGGITVTYGVNFHSITLSGFDSLANYESLLRTLQYRNTKTFPNLTSRVITVVVQDDGSASSATATATVNFDDGQSPSIDLNGSAPGTGYDVVFQTPGPVDVYIVDTSNATITDPDSARLDYLKAVLTSRPDGSSEQLVVDTTGTSLVATYNASTGELLITAATPQPIGDFQQVLRTLRYQNSKLFPTPNMRTIVVTVSDGYSTASATATVSFRGPLAPTLDLDDADTTASGSDYIAQFPSPGSGTSVAIVNPSGLVITDPDSTHLTRAQALLINRPDGANESLTVNSSLVPAGVTVSYNPASGLLDIVGLATVAQYQALLRSLSYQNTKPFPTLTSRTIQVVVNDGYGTSNVATATVNFVGAAPPSVDLNGPANPGIDYTVNFSTPGPGSVIVTHATATIDDPDSTHLRWLEAVLTARPDGNSNERLLVASLPASLSQVYNPATGVLHIEGTGPVPKADFITALQNLQYQNDLVFPSLTPRSIQVYVNDGYTTSAIATATVNILGGQSPSVDLNGPASGTDFTTTLPVGNTQVGIVDPSMTVTDPDSLILAGATIRITNLLDGGAESLDVNVGSSGISKSYDATTGTLTLSGLATVADYQTVLRTLVYQNTAMFPTRTTRQITVVVTDGYTNSNVATAFVNFAPNTLATVDLNGPAAGTNTTVQYQTPGPNQVVLAPQAQIIEDSNHLLYVELVLSNHPDGGNEGLNIAGALPGGLSWVYNAGTFTGRIQGPGTKADFETALRQVVYFNNAVLPNLTTRAIQVVAHDGYGVGGSSTAAVVFLGGATPSVDLNGAGAGNDYVVTVATPGPVDVAVVDAGATINDADSTHLTLLRAVLTSRPDGSANERLVVDTTGTGLVANYNATTGVLTVTAGTPRPRSEFQQVLRTLRYQNSRQYPTLPGRTIEVTVSDGYTTSAIATATVNILGGQSPSVDLNGPAAGTGFSVNVSTPGPVDVGVVASSASISDPDSSLLVSLQAVLTSRPDGNSNEQLVVDTSGTGLVANYNATTGVLTVSAASPRPLSEFEQVLRTLRYQNSVFYPALPGRTIQVTVNDGYTTSAIATATVNFLGAGQPVVDLNGPNAGTGFSVTWQTPGPVDVAIVSSSAASITDPDSTHLVRLRVVLTNVLDGSNERLVANTTGTSLSANYNASTGVLIIGTSSNVPRPLAEFEQVLRTLRYQNDATWPNPATRTIQVHAFDGYTNGPVATATVAFVGAAAAPVVDLNGGSSGINNTVTYTSGGVRIAPGAIISDSDSPQLNRVTIRLLNRPDNSDEALTANTSGTRVTALPYDPSTGVLTLLGPAPLSEFQQVLRTVRYVNNRAIPAPDNRTIQVTANDGYNNSATAIATVVFPTLMTVPNPNGSGNALYVIGTAGGDIIQVKPFGTSSFQVVRNGQNLGTFALSSYRRLIVRGQGGDDRIEVDRTLNLPSILDGGPGNDVLLGGAGADVLLGGAGNDQLYGRGGRDILIGGTGADQLYGHEPGQTQLGSDQDILIGDSTVYDSDLAALARLVDRWAGSGTYSQRVSALLSGVGVPALNTTKVIFDNAVDRLTGGWDQDWFFRLNNQDVLTDRVSNERIN